MATTAHLDAYGLRPEHALNFPPGSDTWYVCAPRGITDEDIARGEKKPTKEDVTIRITENTNDSFIYFDSNEETVPTESNWKTKTIISPASGVKDFSVKDFSKALPSEFSLKFNPEQTDKLSLFWKFPPDVKSVSVKWTSESMARELGFVEGTVFPKGASSEGSVLAPRSVLGNFAEPYPGLKLNTNRNLPASFPSILLPCCYKNVPKKQKLITCSLCKQDVEPARIIAHVEAHPRNTVLPERLRWQQPKEKPTAVPVRLSADRRIRSKQDQAALPVNIQRAWDGILATDNRTFYRIGVPESPRSFLDCLNDLLGVTDIGVRLQNELRKGIRLQETFELDKLPLI